MTSSEFEDNDTPRDDGSPALLDLPITADPQSRAIHVLIDVIQRLSLARSMDAIVDIVRVAARDLTGADGATFVLRDGEQCFYVDEYAIEPLWKGQRFPLQACISGWAMLNSKSAVIPDIYQDSRIPHAAYRPTFVRSLAMVPIRSASPIGAIGNYWATPHHCTTTELRLLEALANTTAVAMENVAIYQSLENQVQERTRDLRLLNEELDSFASAVSHDLRAPLRAIDAELHLRTDSTGSLPSTSVTTVRNHTARMAKLIDDLLRLSRITAAQVHWEQIELSALAREILTSLRAGDSDRACEIHVQPDIHASGDIGLLRVVLGNLLGNAWKYTGKRDVARISFTCEADESSGHPIYCISDNGAGFDQELTDRLFQPFVRLHGPSEFPGTGIGLATVRRIIQRHGGDIWATGEIDQGAQFCFTLGAAPDQ